MSSTLVRQASNTINQAVAHNQPQAISTNAAFAQTSSEGRADAPWMDSPTSTEQLREQNQETSRARTRLGEHLPPPPVRPCYLSTVTIQTKPDAMTLDGIAGQSDWHRPAAVLTGTQSPCHVVGGIGAGPTRPGFTNE